MSKFYEIKGLTKLQKAFSSFESDVLEGQVDAVRESILKIHETAVGYLQDNTDGPSEERYKPRRTVHVSPPGTPPNTDTGRAVQSIKFDFENKGLLGRVGTNLKYLAMLEFGTENVAPRPWLSSAVAETAKEVADIFAKAVRNVIKKAGV